GYARVVLGKEYVAKIDGELSTNGQMVFALEEGGEVKAPKATQKKAYQLPSGKFHLVEQDSPAKAYEIFANHVNSKVPGFCVTHLHPDIIKREMGTDAFEILYLSDEQDMKAAGAISPKRMKFEISQRISKFLAERELEAQPGILFMPSVTNLYRYNGFDEVYEFIDKTAKKLPRSNSYGLMHIKPGSFLETEAKQLKDVIGG
ncbi:MAG TPA: DUF835 domain-containing protein, partial [Candidatus Nanoarchaeia archaeon]|nr:DUF835 domain-containing protein [Candidatus Nanoarchaeia archaeon]